MLRLVPPAGGLYTPMSASGALPFSTQSTTLDRMTYSSGAGPKLPPQWFSVEAGFCPDGFDPAKHAGV
jgi:hypothetical protein